MSEEIVMQVPVKPQLPPRIARNKSELAKYLEANSIASQWPAIEQQLFTYPISDLEDGAYNPSIIRYRGKLVMSYRFHESTLKTKLAMAELDENFNVISRQVLDMDEEESCEDSRLFIFKGELWMNFVVSNWPQFPASQSKIAKLSKPDKWRISDKLLYWLPDRQTSEKNHLALPFDDVLHIVYHHNKFQDGALNQIIYTPSDKREMKTPALRWPYGEIRGGTVPIPYKDKLISFFHSSLTNEEPPTPHRYFCGAMLMKADMPFQMLAVSKRPILRGSEIGGDATRFHFKKNIIFCLGAIEHEDGWLVSCGINDSQCALVKINPENLNL